MSQLSKMFKPAWCRNHRRRYSRLWVNVKFNIVTNHNGVGLQADAEVLGDALKIRGHEVIASQYNASPQSFSDVNIFLELVAEQYFPAAKQNWLVPNPEWFFLAQFTA